MSEHAPNAKPDRHELQNVEVGTALLAWACALCEKRMVTPADDWHESYLEMVRHVVRVHRHVWDEHVRDAIHLGHGEKQP